MSSNVSDGSAAGSNPNESRHPPEGADPLTSSGTEPQADIQVEGSPQAPPSTVDGTQATRSDGDRAQEAPVPAQHDNATCYLPGCDRIAEESQMCEDGSINRVCSEHKKPALVITTVTRAEKCEYTGCERTPRYGVQGGPLSFCQGHKRAGMYTCRDGELFVATRDGSALRDASGGSASGASASGASAAAVATDTSRQTPTPAPPQEPKNELSLLVLPRKVCEEPGCEAQPSFGLPGSGNPQYCSSHKKEGLVSLKNRPCVQPGCNTRPHYGVSGEKAVFCVTHKLPGMVHLLKEAKTLEKEAHALRRRKSRLNIAEKKRKEKEARAGKVDATTERPAQEQEEDGGGSHEKQAQEEEEGEGGSREGKGKGKRPARAKGVPRKAAFPAEAMQMKASKTTAGAATTKPSPSPSSSTPASSPRPSSGQKQRKPYAPRPEDPAGLAPSDEMRLFQEARELARASAEASGSGRRARAPSRKILEASGKLAGGSIQWMTKEKREEEARRTQEIKEQRKAAAAAGLKLGHVIETITLPSASEAAESRPAGGGSGGGGAPSGGASSGGASSGATSSSPTSSGATSSGATSSSPASSGGPSSDPASSGGFSSGAASSGGFSSGEEAPAARAFGRQLSPAQPLLTAGNTAASGGAEQSPACSRDTTDKANGGAITNEQERPVAPAPPAEAGTTTVAGKRWNATASDVEGDEARASKRSRHANGDAGSDGSKDKSGKAACESENCLKTAKYGINGIVRYCKKHQIFGMQKIVDAR